jgi:hypothetical protein
LFNIFTKLSDKKNKYFVVESRINDVILIFRNLEVISIFPSATVMRKLSDGFFFLLIGRHYTVAEGNIRSKPPAFFAN